MFFPRPINQNIDLVKKEIGTILSKEEKVCLKQAEDAERAFRLSKGYLPDTWWNRLRKKMKSK